MSALTLLAPGTVPLHIIDAHYIFVESMDGAIYSPCPRLVRCLVGAGCIR